MTFLSMAVSQEQQYHLLIKEKISIGLKRHQDLNYHYNEKIRIDSLETTSDAT